MCLNLSCSSPSGFLASSFRGKHIISLQRWWLILEHKSRDKPKFRVGKGRKRLCCLVLCPRTSNPPSPLLATCLPPLFFCLLSFSTRILLTGLKASFETVLRAQMPCKSPVLWECVFKGLQLQLAGTLRSPAAKNKVGELTQMAVAISCGS